MHRPPEGAILPPISTFGQALRRQATPVALAVAAVCTLGLAVNIWMTATFFGRVKPLGRTAPAAWTAAPPVDAAETEPKLAEDSPYSTTSTRVTISSRGSNAGQ
jgi:hypothetical protein